MSDTNDVTMSEDGSDLSVLPGAPPISPDAALERAGALRYGGRQAISSIHALTSRTAFRRGASPLVDFLASGAPPAWTHALSGTSVRQYEIVRALGRGGMGVVFLARDRQLDRLVALKFLRPRAHRVESLLHEARMMARFQHENIAAVYEVSADAGCPFLALEYVEGQTLRDAVVDVRDAVRFMSAVARALTHAHELGIVHCDLKPENILVSDAGRVKVVDFGLARSVARSKDCVVALGASTGPGSVRPVGTLRYMSPEQLRNQDIDERSDLWAVGVILYELVTGRHPIATADPGWIREAMDLEAPMPEAARLRSSLGALDHVIARCLRKRRDERFQSAKELSAALEAISGGERRGVGFRSRRMRVSTSQLHLRRRRDAGKQELLMPPIT